MSYFNRLQLIITAGAKLNLLKDPLTPHLLYAARDSASEIITFLIQTVGVEVDALNKAKQSPLSEAVKANQPEAIQVLLDNEANPNQTDEHGVPLLSIALRKREYLKIANSLREKGAKLSPYWQMKTLSNRMQNSSKKALINWIEKHTR